jgi:hypothetical protein
MELEDIMLSEISQVQKEKCFMISLMWNLKELISDVESYWRLGTVEGDRRGGSVGVMLLLVRRITSSVLWNRKVNILTMYCTSQKS